MSIILDSSIIKKRIHIINYLKKKGVGTSIYYPKIIPMFSFYKKNYEHINISKFESSRIISDNSICLPIGPHINKRHLNYIFLKLKEAINIYAK